MRKNHENLKELVLRLAKTDFKLRYHGSTLGYLFGAVLRPLLMFTVLNFVFSSIFNFRNSERLTIHLNFLPDFSCFNSSLRGQ